MEGVEGVEEAGGGGKGVRGSLMRLGEASMKPLSFIPVLSLTAINLSGAYPAARHYLCSQDGERRRGVVHYENGAQQTDGYVR